MPSNTEDSDRVTMSDRVNRLRERPAGERTDAIEQLAALLWATTAELLDLVAAADAEEDWKVDGATGMIPWLVGILNVNRDTARGWVTTGAALDRLPSLRQALSDGAMSYDQTRPAATFVTPATDEHQTRYLQGCTAAQIEDLARQHRVRSRRDAADAGARRFFRSRVDHSHGGRRFTGFLPESEAARLDNVLDLMAERNGPDEDTGVFESVDTRRADSLVDLADNYAGASNDADTALVVVHAPAEVLDGKVDANGQIEDLQVARDSVLRLLCDCKLEFSIDTPQGLTIGIARADRTIPRWLRRRIQRRDGHTCRFPGCERRIRQIHHIRWWRDGGATNADNLVGLCWHHHRLVHEGGWTLRGNPDHKLAFTSPHGRTITSNPAPLRDDVRQRTRHARHHHDGSAAHTGPVADRGAEPDTNHPLRT